LELLQILPELSALPQSKRSILEQANLDQAVLIAIKALCTACEKSAYEAGYSEACLDIAESEIV